MTGRIFALMMCLGTAPASANQIDYFCLFNNAAAAQADATMGQYWNAATAAWDQSQTFPGVKVTTPQAVVNGISSLTGFWIVVSTTGANAALDGDTACVMKLDRDAAILSGAFVLSSVIAGANRTSLTFTPVPHGSRYPRPLGQ